MKTRHTLRQITVVLATTFSLIGAVTAQSVYTANWSTLNGSEGSYTVDMELTKGPLIQGVKSYTLGIENNNGRDFFDNGASVVTTGPNNDVALEINRMGAVGDPFKGLADIVTSDVYSFTNITDIHGRLQNPWGTSRTTFPIDLQEGERASMQWTTRNFGFETLRTDPDAEKGGTNVWDEWTMQVSQTWTPVPEPSSAALLGLGGIALIFRKRK